MCQLYIQNLLQLLLFDLNSLSVQSLSDIISNNVNPVVFKVKLLSTIDKQAYIKGVNA